MIDRARSSLHSSVLALNRLYMAVHVVSARRAFCLLCKGNAEVVSIEDGTWMVYDFDGWREVSELQAELGEDDPIEWIRSVTFVVRIPRVIRLLGYDRVPRKAVKFTRRNVFLRDEYRCQYCRGTFGPGNLSLDHVLPRSRGGQTTWDNIVTACMKCNVRKGGRTPEEARMDLLCRPKKPARSPVLAHQIATEKYESWRTFLD